MTRRCRSGASAISSSTIWGIKAYQAGELEQALGHFREALRRAPANTGAALNKIQVLLQLMQKNRKSRSLAPSAGRPWRCWRASPQPRPAGTFSQAAPGISSAQLISPPPLTYADT